VILLLQQYMNMSMNIPEQIIGEKLAELSNSINSSNDIASGLSQIEGIVNENNANMATTTQGVSDEMKQLLATVQIIKDKINYFKEEDIKCRQQIEQNQSEINTYKKQLEKIAGLESSLRAVQLENNQFKQRQLELNRRIASGEQLNGAFDEVVSNLNRTSSENAKLRIQIQALGFNKEEALKKIDVLTRENAELKARQSRAIESIQRTYVSLNNKGTNTEGLVELVGILRTDEENKAAVLIAGVITTYVNKQSISTYDKERILKYVTNSIKIGTKNTWEEAKAQVDDLVSQLGPASRYDAGPWRLGRGGARTRKHKRGRNKNTKRQIKN